MKTVTIPVMLTICGWGELPEPDRHICEAACEAAKGAYAPYSGFHVGAAVLLENGRIIKGSNQENAAYPSGLCAERVALFSAGAQYPDVPVTVLAIAAYIGDQPVEQISPCGACRQVMLETENRYQTPVRVILCGPEQFRILENVRMLLPIGFDASELNL